MNVPNADFRQMCAGVMVIITWKIVINDILPFIVFAATMIAAFESASTFFSWMMKEDHQPGGFFQRYGEINYDSLCATTSYSSATHTVCCRFTGLGHFGEFAFEPTLWWDTT